MSDNHHDVIDVSEAPSPPRSFPAKDRKDEEKPKPRRPYVDPAAEAWNRNPNLSPPIRWRQ